MLEVRLQQLRTESRAPDESQVTSDVTSDGRNGLRLPRDGNVGPVREVLTLTLTLNLNVGLRLPRDGNVGPVR